MSYGVPDASRIYSKSGESLRKAGDYNQAVRYGMMNSGLTAEAKQRANQYRIDAMEKIGDIQSRSTITNAFIGAGADMLSAGLDVGLKNMKAGSSGAGDFYNDPSSLKTDAWDWKPEGWDMNSLNKAYTSQDLPNWSGGW